MEKTFFSCNNSTITCKLYEDRRLVIGISNSFSTISYSLIYYLFGCHLSAFYLSSLTDVIILTIFAQPVTTSSSYGIDTSTRSVMSNRFFLDRIDMTSNHFAINKQLEFSAFVSSNTTKTNLLITKFTISSTCCTTNLIVW